MLHAFDDLAPDGVLAVEEAAVVGADEELAVGAVRVVGPRHRGGAAQVRLAAELGLEVGLIGAAGAGAGRVTALGHEALDDSVEGDAVVEALLRELADPRDMAGGEVGPQADDDVAAAIEVEDQSVELVRHRRLRGSSRP